jgi:hypothetical protein
MTNRQLPRRHWTAVNCNAVCNPGWAPLTDALRACARAAVEIASGG